MNDTKTAASPVLVIRRTFNAPRERVFECWTNPELIRAWFAPEEMTLTEVAFDARQGGRYRTAMKAADGEDFIVSGVITDFKRPERLAYTFRWQEDDPQTERDTYVRIEFLDRGAQTEMVFTQEGFVDEASRDRHNEGWSSILTQFAAAL